VKAGLRRFLDGLKEFQRDDITYPAPRFWNPVVAGPAHVDVNKEVHAPSVDKAQAAVQPIERNFSRSFGRRDHRDIGHLDRTAGRLR